MTRRDRCTDFRWGFDRIGRASSLAAWCNLAAASDSPPPWLASPYRTCYSPELVQTKPDYSDRFPRDPLRRSTHSAWCSEKCCLQGLSCSTRTELQSDLGRISELLQWWVQHGTVSQWGLPSKIIPGRIAYVVYRGGCTVQWSDGTWAAAEWPGDWNRTCCWITAAGYSVFLRLWFSRHKSCWLQHKL